MKVSIILQDKPDGGINIRMEFDPPISDSGGDLTDAGQLGFELVKTITRCTTRDTEAE